MKNKITNKQRLLFILKQEYIEISTSISKKSHFVIIGRSKKQKIFCSIESKIDALDNAIMEIK